jgi:hypothetical protein
VVAVETRALDRLTGTYRFTPDFSIRITRGGERLFSHATGQERRELFPESDRVFFFKVVDAVLSFDGDSEATAMQVVLRQDGKDYIGERVP